MRASINETALPQRIPGGWHPKRLSAVRPLWLLVAGLAGLVAVAALIASGAIAVRSPLSSVPATPPGLTQQMVVQSLTRTGVRPEGVMPDVTAMLITPELVAVTGNRNYLDLVAAPSILFYLYEEAHDDLPAQPPEPRLSLVGAGLVGASERPAEVRVLSDSFHHRAVLVRYALAGSLAHLEHGMGERLDLRLPAGPGVEATNNVLSWDLPIRFPGTAFVANPVLSGGAAQAASTVPVAPGAPLSLAVILGMFAGFLASMWPCLFQLTVYFIPSLAGLSLGQAAAQQAPVVLRRRVLKTALFFVLGIVIVYTAAGAIVGFAAQSLSGTDLYQTWQRPLSLVAAGVMVVMAIRIAAQSRAPLVCKMPFLTHVGKRGAPGPLGTMVLGLAFATGCMTCFGSALVLGMLMYTISSASMLTGAFLLFCFSLGISIPLVGAALVIAQLLPLLERLERFARWMALASCAIMLAFAGLLVSGQYHVLSTTIVRTVTGS